MRLTAENKRPAQGRESALIIARGRAPPQGSTRRQNRDITGEFVAPLATQTDLCRSEGLDRRMRCKTDCSL